MGSNTADASPLKDLILGASALGAHRLYGLAELWWVACSVALALGISVATGLMPKWGQWYSVNMAYRRQTEAMLNGSLALDKDPRTVGYDMAWASDGVQQVWGLGVPSWRLPFELLAKLFGTGGVSRPPRAHCRDGPTHLLLAQVACTLASARRRALCQAASGSRRRRIMFDFVSALSGACRTRFDVYEEAQAYSYIASIALFAMTLVCEAPEFSQLPSIGGALRISRLRASTLIC